VGEQIHQFLSTVSWGTQGSPHTCLQPEHNCLFSTCGKKTTHEVPGRRQGHEGLEEPLVLDPRLDSRL
jgi:hypothetical protein